eukprot:3227436-Pyramimonas_sp.AAC.1
MRDAHNNSIHPLERVDGCSMVTGDHSTNPAPPLRAALKEQEESTPHDAKAVKAEKTEKAEKPSSKKEVGVAIKKKISAAAKQRPLSESSDSENTEDDME